MRIHTICSHSSTVSLTNIEFTIFIEIIFLQCRHSASVFPEDVSDVSRSSHEVCVECVYYSLRCPIRYYSEKFGYFCFKIWSTVYMCMLIRIFWMWCHSLYVKIYAIFWTELLKRYKKNIKWVIGVISVMAISITPNPILRNRTTGRKCKIYLKRIFSTYLRY